MRPVASLSLALATAATSASAAGAQTVDYSALENVIGEPVTTSVTGKPQRASELPASTVVITAEQIARSPARDVPGLLKVFAGVDVNRWTAGQSDVAVRGGVQTYNARLLVLVDGRQVYLDHYGMTNWNLLGVAIEDIQQIELVRGPASALFGFNASSGVVNIVTRQAQPSLAARATVVAGDHGVSRLAASLQVPVTATLAVKLVGGRLREDERDVPASLLARPRHGVVADHLSGEVTARIGVAQAVVGGGYADNRQLEFLPSQLLSNQHYRSSNVHAAVTRDTAWGGIAAMGFVNWLDAEYGTDGSIGGVSPSLALSNRIMSVQASGLYRLGSADTLRLGVEYRNNRVTGDAQYAETIAYDVASGSAMIELHPAGRVTATAAARLDRLWLHQSGAIAVPALYDPAAYDRAFDRVSLNAAVQVRTGEDGLLRINGGRGYQLPSLTTYGFRLEVPLPPPLSLIVAGSPAIRPVRTWSGEIGYTHRLGETRIEATAFYTDTDGAIAPPHEAGAARADIVFLPGPTIVQRYFTAGNYSTRGVELSLSGRVAALGWRANYTWTHTRERFDDLGSPAPLPVSPRATTPRHKANVVLEYDPGAHWYLTGLARYTSGTRQFGYGRPAGIPRVGIFAVDPAVALDARLGYRLNPRAEVFLAGENLTMARGAALSPIAADRRVRAGLRLNL